MSGVRWFNRSGAHLALVFGMLLHAAGIPLLAHHGGGGWTLGSAIHAPGDCPDGGPAHNERACRTYQTPTPEAVAGRAVRFAPGESHVQSAVITAWRPAGLIDHTSVQARAPPFA